MNRRTWLASIVGLVVGVKAAPVIRGPSWEMLTAKGKAKWAAAESRVASEKMDRAIEKLWVAVRLLERKLKNGN